MNMRQNNINIYIYIEIHGICISFPWQNMCFHQVSCAVCAVCSPDRGIPRPSRRDGDEDGETALTPPYLDPAMAVQWSLDGEVTPL